MKKRMLKKLLLGFAVGAILVSIFILASGCIILLDELPPASYQQEVSSES